MVPLTLNLIDEQVGMELETELNEWGTCEIRLKLIYSPAATVILAARSRTATVNSSQTASDDRPLRTATKTKFAPK